MNIARNLQYLRKKKKLTQEELANRLNVSRQSVSKWETGDGYPEMDKLMQLSDLFEVSVDDLLRAELEEEITTEVVGIQRNEAFLKTINHFSLAISLGVFFILFGVALCVTLSGFGYMVDASLKKIFEIISGSIVLIFVAIAVFLFIFFGMNYDRFRKQNMILQPQYTKEECQVFSKKFIFWMAGLVSGIILDVVFLVLSMSLIELGRIESQNKESIYCFITAIFLFLLGCIVGKLIHLGIQQQKYNIGEYNKSNRLDFNSSFNGRLKNALCGVIMMLATIVFLILGFVWNLWHPGWVCFPVGGILCGILTTILQIKDSETES